MATRRKKPSSDAETGVGPTTSFEIERRTLLVLRSVAALRAAKGETFKFESGQVRPYTVSILIREALAKAMPGYEKELAAGGFDLAALEKAMKK